MARTNFENLRVYKLSEKLADHIWDVTLGWSIFARDTVGKQLVKAADSIGANISEGSGRGSFVDNRDSFGWRGDHSTKLNTGLGVRSNGNY